MNPTPKQRAYLDFIAKYIDIHHRPPAEAEMQAFLGTTPPSVHQMVITLTEKGLITGESVKPRSIRLVARPDAAAEVHRRPMSLDSGGQAAGWTDDAGVVPDLCELIQDRRGVSKNVSKTRVDSGVLQWTREDNCFDRNRCDSRTLATKDEQHRLLTKCRPQGFETRVTPQRNHRRFRRHYSRP